MPENQQAKKEIRLQQAVRIVEAVIQTFGEPMILDALAVTLKTPDGRKLIECSSTLTKLMDQPAELLELGIPEELDELVDELEQG